MGLSKYLVVLAGFFLSGCLEQQITPPPKDAAEDLSPAPAIELAGRVTDQASILSEDQSATISRKLEQLEASTQHQVVVATVSSLGGREIKPYTTELANAWGIGRREVDDGVVVLIAPNERKVRIAVGYGLETTLTDQLCAEIIEDAMLPNFREGDYFSGIDAGIDALIAALQ
ncbi:MAG: TPM domain-containing protein [Pseudomonadota bacterium]